MSCKIAVLSILTTFCVLVTWQYNTRHVDTPWKPSVAFECTATSFQSLWKKIGVVWAHICSFLARLQLEEVYESIVDIVRPLIDLFLSWSYFFKGFSETAMSYVNVMKPYANVMIYIGCFVLMASAIFSIWWFELLAKLGRTQIGIWMHTHIISRITLGYLLIISLTLTTYICGFLLHNSSLTWITDILLFVGFFIYRDQYPENPQ